MQEGWHCWKDIRTVAVQRTKTCPLLMSIDKSQNWNMTTHLTTEEFPRGQWKHNAIFKHFLLFLLPFVIETLLAGSACLPSFRCNYVVRNRLGHCQWISHFVWRSSPIPWGNCVFKMKPLPESNYMPFAPLLWAQHEMVFSCGLEFPSLLQNATGSHGLGKFKGMECTV